MESADLISLLESFSNLRVSNNANDRDQKTLRLGAIELSGNRTKNTWDRQNIQECTELLTKY
jgi:hypothetical protein